MKKLAFLSFVMFALVACNNNQKNDAAENMDDQETIQETVGDDRDAHGCITSSGETWSELLQGCIQVFNVGQRLNPVATAEGETITSAFVVFNEDNSKLELYLPNDAVTVILDNAGNGIYQNETVKYDSKAAALYINGEKQYIQE